MLELADPPKTTTKSSSNHRPSDANRRLVFGIHAGLEESAGGYLVLFVVTASSKDDALHRVSLKERRAVFMIAEYLGIEGTDELAHAEDEWASAMLEQHLFRNGGDSIALGNA